MPYNITDAPREDLLDKREENKMAVLIITEKSSVAERFSHALLGESAVPHKVGKVTYYNGKTGDGRDTIIAPLSGHIYIVDYLPEDQKRWDYPCFRLHTQLLLKLDKEKAGYVKTIEEILKRYPITDIVAAGDTDSEGSALVGNLLRVVCGLPEDYQPTGKEKYRFSRMEFSALTPQEIQRAFNNLKPFDTHRTRAGFSRAVIDLEVGANITRGLTHAARNARIKVKVLSSGRCQSPTLAELLKRENEIRAFKPEKYWTIVGLFEGDNKQFEAEYVDLGKTEHKKRVMDIKQAERIIADCKQTGGGLLDIYKKTVRESPPPPFELTSLQREVYTRFGIPPARTQSIANDLYHSALISYSRTGGDKWKAAYRTLNYFNPLFQKLRGFPPLEKDVEYVTKNLRWPCIEGTKEDPAHPPIHPVSIPTTPLEEAKSKIYTLIARRFLSTFAPDCVIDRTTFKVTVGPHIFMTSGSTIVDSGYRTVHPPLKTEEKELPPLKSGTKVRMVDIRLEEKETTPPKRFSEASIIKVMQDLGVGTKATRAQIVKTLHQRGYFTQPRGIILTPLGRGVGEALATNTPKLANPQFTSDLQNALSQIESGTVDYNQVINKYLSEFEQIMKEFKTKEKEIGVKIAERAREAPPVTAGPVEPPEVCPKCGGKLIQRRGKWGAFIGCENYPTCRFVQSIKKRRYTKPPEKGAYKPTPKTCPYCNGGLVIRSLKFGKALVCPKYPACKGVIFPLKRKTFKLKAPIEAPVVKRKTQPKQAGRNCPLCGRALVHRKSRYGVFVGCSGFPSCTYIETQKQSGTRAEAAGFLGGSL